MISGVVNDGRTIPGMPKPSEVVVASCKITGNILSGSFTYTFENDYSSTPTVCPQTPEFISGASISGGWTQYGPDCTQLTYGGVDSDGASGVLFLEEELGGASSGVTYKVPAIVYGETKQT